MASGGKLPDDLGLGRLGGPGALTITAPPPAPISSSMVQAETSPSKARVLGFHEDRVPDAQEFYSSEFCVFVAKYALPESIPGLDTDGQTFCSLPQSQSDETLEAAVTETFSKFGTVFVKIRRDTRNQMPYGFAQFTVECPECTHCPLEGKRQYHSWSSLSHRACEGKLYVEWILNLVQEIPLILLGQFVLYRRDGSVMTRAEVTNLMEVQGTLARVEPLHSQTQSLTNFPETAWLVTYDLFDPRRDVVGVFANHMTYNVRPFNHRDTSDRIPVPGGGHHAPNDKYGSNGRSIYIANLPVDIDEGAVRAIVSGFNRVQRVQLRQTTTNTLDGRRAYAFVEFDHADVADAAIAQLNGLVAPDNQGFLRVQRRIMHPFPPNRSQGPFSAQSHVNRELYPQVMTNSAPREIGEGHLLGAPNNIQETPMKQVHHHHQELQAAASTPSELGQVTPANTMQAPPPSIANPMSPMSPMGPMSPMSPWIHTSPYGNPFAATMGYSPFAGSQYTMMTPQASPAMYYPQQSPQPHFSPFVMAPHMPAAYYHPSSWAAPGFVPGAYMVDSAAEGQATDQDSNDHDDGVHDTEAGHSQVTSEGGVSLKEE
ncbi:uncharacterized protein VDAG_02449 [Verticillium dahliae VdLs.17]|uniref:RRM domain-containing protein n=1 Tax=Verticillium dahliae (strain VdLs.17 / ATCC MYA-4575 / FGSC 10137) TaxID=498257 RepID=G2WXW7_VERDV|nr:uncharacterized protein VDAG_02449 [Verticillium dahliae VdLs.17]EGY20925.1 hypothetical protein VDAG_02449 [Verticillium dahliae VdLs.17]